MAKRPDHYGIHTYVSRRKLQKDFVEARRNETSQLVLKIAARVAAYERPAPKREESLVDHSENMGHRILIVPDDPSNKIKGVDSVLKFVFDEVSYRTKEEIRKAGGVAAWAEGQLGYPDALVAERRKLDAQQ